MSIRRPTFQGCRCARITPNNGRGRLPYFATAGAAEEVARRGRPKGLHFGTAGARRHSFALHDAVPKRCRHYGFGTLLDPSDLVRLLRRSEASESRRMLAISGGRRWPWYRRPQERAGRLDDTGTNHLSLGQFGVVPGHPITTRPPQSRRRRAALNRTTDFTCRSAVLIVLIFRSLPLWSSRVLFVELLSIRFLLGNGGYRSSESPPCSGRSL